MITVEVINNYENRGRRTCDPCHLAAH